MYKSCELSQKALDLYPNRMFNKGTLFTLDEPFQGINVIAVLHRNPDIATRSVAAESPSSVVVDFAIIEEPEKYRDPSSKLVSPSRRTYETLKGCKMMFENLDAADDIEMAEEFSNQYWANEGESTHLRNTSVSFDAGPTSKIDAVIRRVNLPSALQLDLMKKVREYRSLEKG